MYREAEENLRMIPGMTEKWVDSHKKGKEGSSPFLLLPPSRFALSQKPTRLVPSSLQTRDSSREVEPTCPSPNPPAATQHSNS
jgi:hypothetical protein